MATTEYTLTADDWTDCGASDDCTAQVIASKGVAILTTAAAKPSSGSTAGLRIGLGDGLYRDAVIKRAGMKLFARALSAPFTLVVER